MENFAAGMPTDLAFKFAARQAIFEQILQGQPNHAKSHYMLGLCYVGEDNNTEAAPLLTAAGLLLTTREGLMAVANNTQTSDSP